MSNEERSGENAPLSDDELDGVTGGSNPPATLPPQPPSPGQAGDRNVGTGPEGATPPPGPGSND